jgi:hypothetical protein
LVVGKKTTTDLKKTENSKDRKKVGVRLTMDKSAVQVFAAAAVISCHPRKEVTKEEKDAIDIACNHAIRRSDARATNT